MAEKTAVIVYQKCVWEIDIDRFITKRSITDIKRLLRYAFSEWHRNVNTIEEISALVTKKKTEALINAKIHPTDRQNEKRVKRYASLIAYIETMKNKVKMGGENNAL